MKRLVLLQTPAHAAGEIKRVMPARCAATACRSTTPASRQPLEGPVKEALLKHAGAFDALVDAAKDWERVHSAREKEAGNRTAGIR